MLLEIGSSFTEKNLAIQAFHRKFIYRSTRHCASIVGVLIDFLLLKVACMAHRCEVHDTTKNLLFCVTCSKVSCLECVTDESHENHKWSSIEKAEEETKQRTNERIQVLRSKLHDLPGVPDAEERVRVKEVSEIVEGVVKEFRLAHDELHSAEQSIVSLLLRAARPSAEVAEAIEANLLYRQVRIRVNALTQHAVGLPLCDEGSRLEVACDDVLTQMDRRTREVFASGSVNACDRTVDLAAYRKLVERMRSDVKRNVERVINDAERGLNDPVETASSDAGAPVSVPVGLPDSHVLSAAGESPAESDAYG